MRGLRSCLGRAFWFKGSKRGVGGWGLRACTASGFGFPGGFRAGHPYLDDPKLCAGLQEAREGLAEVRRFWGSSGASLRLKQIHDLPRRRSLPNVFRRVGKFYGRGISGVRSKIRLADFNPTSKIRIC